MIRSFFGANATTDEEDKNCALSRKHKLLPLLRARSKDSKAFVLKVRANGGSKEVGREEAPYCTINRLYY
jgi:hypothetical protein